jgi:hypothetical protein
VASRVELTFVAARRARRTILVRWRSASEVHVLGFNVYCGSASNRMRSNRRLIAAVGSKVRGHVYSYAEPVGTRHRFGPYWVQVVHQRGSVSWYGPARVR